MGTEFRIVLFATDETSARIRADAAFDECDRIEELLSNYKATSELSRINAAAFDNAVTTDPETFSFLAQSQHWSEASGGAFDITVGPLMKLWGFYKRQGRVPSQVEIDSTLTRVGYKHIHLNPQGRSIRFSRPGMDLDPGGIGKGFAVDAMVRVLREQGTQAALISAGSSTLYALGHPPQKSGWLVVVRMPNATHQRIAAITLRDESLSSANCSEKNFTANGILYCHIMDPRTGRPVTGRIHVTVTHASATASDALSNVLFVADPAAAANILARSAARSRALIVYAKGKTTRCLNLRWPTACTIPR